MTLAHLNKRRYLLAILMLALLMRVPLIFRPLTYSHSDTWRQADTASIARFFYLDGYDIFNPQIYWGGDGPGYVEAEFQLFPFITALLYQFFGEQVWLGRLVSLVFTIPALWVIFLLARRITDEKVALGALFFMAISPLNIRYSVAFMPEATVFFFFVLALYLFYIWIEEQQVSLLWFAGISTSLAILVKPTAIMIGLFYVMLLVNRFKLQWLKRWEIWAFGAICLIPPAVYFYHARHLYLTYGNTFGLFSGGDSKFGDLNTWLSPFFYYHLIQLDTIWVFGWVSLLICGVGLGALFQSKQLRFVLFGLLTTLIYYMIVARYAQQDWGIQYHIYILPFVAIAVGAGLNWLRDRVNQNISEKQTAFVGFSAILLFALLGSGYVSKSLLQPANQNFVDCGHEIADIVPEDALIIVSTTSVAIDNGTPNNYQEPNIFFYSNRRGWSLPSDQHDIDHLDQLRQQGADYLIITNQGLYDENPDLVTYLNTTATQIGLGIEAGCAVYALSESE